MELVKLIVPNINLLVMQSLSVALTALLLPRLRITSIFGPILMALALAWVNIKFWDAALFFQIPDEISSKMLMLVAINGLIFFILVKVLPGIEVDGILPALAAPVIFTLCNIIMLEYFKDIDWQAVYNFVSGIFAQAKTTVTK